MYGKASTGRSKPKMAKKPAENLALLGSRLAVVKRMKRKEAS